MRLDTSRLLDSDLFALSTGDEFKAAVALWCKAWTQSPGGSLPDNDVILAKHSGAGSRWSRVKAVALRGWVKCSDGRLYHPVVAEQVLVAWKERAEFMEEREGQARRQREFRAERADKIAELKANGIRVAWNAPIDEVRRLHAGLAAPVTVTSTDLSQPVTVTGALLARDCHTFSHGLDGTGRDGKSFKSSSPDTPLRADTSSGVASAMARALRERGFPECADGLPDLVALEADGYTVAEVIEAADAAARQGGKPIAWIATRVRGRRKDAALRAAEKTPISDSVVIPGLSEGERARRDVLEAYDRACRIHLNDVKNQVITTEEGKNRCSQAKKDRDAALAALGFEPVEEAA